MQAVRFRQGVATAVEMLKTFTARSSDQISLGPMLRRFADDKAFDLNSIRRLAHTGEFSNLVSSLVLRAERGVPDQSVLGYFGKILHTMSPAKIASYRGKPEQNAAIDRAVMASGIGDASARFGQGSATSFFPGGIRFRFDDTRVKSIPIAIIGYGAAGIIVDHALVALGFQKVSVYVPPQRELGIWNQEDVFRRSRNNPQLITFMGQNLEPAPGDGKEVRDFLSRLGQYRLQRSSAPVNRDTVLRVIPGDMNHSLNFKDGDPHTYPIVINCMGLGRPRPLSDPERMVTSSRNKAVRWQQQLLNEENIERKRLVFVGLGNSTAEMLRQAHELQDQGVDVDYRILTHYPAKSIWNPSALVTTDVGEFRVFRDLSVPNLVDFQGDLPENRHDYFRALHNGKIIAGVRRWETKDGVMGVFAHPTDKSAFEEFPYDRCWALIGYEHQSEDLTAMGIAYDSKFRCGHFDYDGEVVADPKSTDPSKRLARGYYGFGAVLDAPYNRNAIVIPGMLHRLGDLLFGVIMRANEYAHRPEE